MTSDPQERSAQGEGLDTDFPPGPEVWSAKRRELLAWFRENAAPVADAYEGAVRLLNDRSFPGRVHFIAHAVRDIADRLVFVLDPQMTPNRVQYENVLDEVMEEWPNLESVGESTDETNMQETVTLNYKLAAMIDSLVAAHRERRRRPSQYELLFRYLMRNEPFEAELNRRLVSDFKAMRGWFMKLTHLRSTAAAEVPEVELQVEFGRFEGMLHSFVGNFYTGTNELDDILREANRSTD